MVEPPLFATPPGTARRFGACCGAFGPRTGTMEMPIRICDIDMAHGLAVGVDAPRVKAMASIGIMTGFDPHCGRLQSFSNCHAAPAKQSLVNHVPKCNKFGSVLIQS